LNTTPPLPPPAVHYARSSCRFVQQLQQQKRGVDQEPIICPLKLDSSTPSTSAASTSTCAKPTSWLCCPSPRRLLRSRALISPSTPAYDHALLGSPPGSSRIPTPKMSGARDPALLLASQPLPTNRLRKLSEAFFNAQNGDKIDLMNDYEIGGTQNKWVCPSDRHLQLRAQLKSGWSVRTVGARSPTGAKAQPVTMTDAEREHIKAVLARAEESKQREQQRIGKMVERLDNLRMRATGDGMSHCLLCRTEFGLLASKSYAAMCMHCRKYVCQKNCGVETTDGRGGETLFLCKICSEAREVLWKKSGAWFYKEMPEYQMAGEVSSAGPGPVMSPPASYPPGSPYGPTSSYPGPSCSTQNGDARSPMKANGGPRTDRTHSSRRRTLTANRDPIDDERSKSPRPRITPSWVKEKVMSSMSVEEEEHSSSDGDFIQSGVRKPPLSKMEMNLAKFELTKARMQESDEESSTDSEPSSHSTSPRRSLATPSSYDSQQPLSVSAPQDGDAHSIDSGVVQSDHSVQQGSSGGGGGTTLPPASSLTPYSSSSSSHVSPPAPISIDLSPLIDRGSRLSLDRSLIELRGGPRDVRELIGNPFNSPRVEKAPIFTRTPPPPSISNDLLPHSSSSSLRGGDGRDSREQNRGAHTSQESLRDSDPRSCSRDSLTLTKKQDDDAIPTASFMSSPDDDSKCDSSGGSSAATAAVDDVPAAAAAPPAASSLALPSSPLSSPTRRSSIEDSAVQDDGTLGSIQFTVTYSAELKQLAVHLIRAKTLKAMDKNGFSDPYVKLHLIPGNIKATKLTSKTIEKTLNPEWNETLVYHGVTAEDKERKSLRITVLDRDRIGSDFLGETRVALKKLADNQTKKFNLYLEHAIPVVNDKLDESERGKLLVALSYNVQQGSLYVTIKRGSEMVGMDSSGFSDPYCKVNLIPPTSKGHRQRTSVKKRTLNPEFNETLTFIVPYKDLKKKTLQVSVFDHDVAKSDDFIGGILLSASAKGERGKHWIECIENPGQTIEYWHKLELD
ncbi:hypothetical protein PENTCL1PPCAC_12097, partial [Pristionchus entomophagus]